MVVVQGEGTWQNDICGLALVQVFFRQGTYADTSITLLQSKAAKKNLRPVIQEPLTAARESLAELPEWSKQSIAETIQKTADNFGINMGKLGQPIRVASTGGLVSPPLDVTLWLVGQKRTIERLDHALHLIAERAQASS